VPRGDVVILESRTPCARKPHYCDWCSRVIDPGETYHRQATIGDDGFYTFRNCQHCQALVAILRLHDLMDGEGVSEEDIMEHEPGTVLHVRLKALWRNQWRRKDGTLYPVPDHGVTS
jgi:hypothetical protein